MTTECNPTYLDFPMLGSRVVLADFDGGDNASDGGGLLLRETEEVPRSPRSSVSAIPPENRGSGNATAAKLWPERARSTASN